MLVLSRKTGQQILIGDNITITILQVKGRTVRVGIDAPADVRVLRSELTDKPQPNLPLRSALKALRRDLPTCLSTG